MASEGKEKQKIKKASALSYTPGEDSAPKVIATGKGVIAEKIIEKARRRRFPSMRMNILQRHCPISLWEKKTLKSFMRWWQRYLHLSAGWMNPTA